MIVEFIYTEQIHNGTQACSRHATCVYGDVGVHARACELPVCSQHSHNILHHSLMDSPNVVGKRKALEDITNEDGLRCAKVDD